MTSLAENLLMLSLAQTGTGGTGTKGSPTGYFLSIGVLVATVVVGTVVVLWVRRRSLAAEEVKDHSSGFMDALRAMHRDGKMSDEEFAAAKAKLSGRLRASMAKPKGRPGGAG